MRGEPVGRVVVGQRIWAQDLITWSGSARVNRSGRSGRRVRRRDVTRERIGGAKARAALTTGWGRLAVVFGVYLSSKGVVLWEKRRAPNPRMHPTRACGALKQRRVCMGRLFPSESSVAWGGAGG